tara:strand:+ start:1517 stop:1846 length:330 start_codon:yes stop_codon:yes gene_type:complete
MLQVITYIDESDCVTKREKQLYEIALDNEQLSECYRRERNKSQEELVSLDSALSTCKKHIFRLCSILNEFEDLCDCIEDEDYRYFKDISKDYLDTDPNTLMANGDQIWP